MNFKKGEVLFFNKPFGWTSFKVVGHARYHICRRIGVKKLKVGHAGTLDPLATGVMYRQGNQTNRRVSISYEGVRSNVALGRYYPVIRFGT